MKKALSLLLMLLIATSVFAGGKQEETAPAQAAEEKTAPVISIAMVTDTGGVNDQSFNQSAWEGLQKAEKDFGINVSYKESSQASDYGPNMESLLDAGNDLIWGIGFLMGDHIKEAAVANPEQNYAIIDFAYGPETPANVVGVTFKEQEPSFLVGYIAAKMTKNNKVGFIGGMKFALIERFEYGFMAGAKYANSEVEIMSQYAESFNDAAKGKSIANGMYQNGCDIIYHASGGTGDGVIEAAKEQGLWAIGVDRDQSDMAPDNVLTSAMKRVDNAVYNIAKEIAEGNFPGGTTVTYGLAEGGVGIAPTSNKHVPSGILAEVKKIEKSIIAGDIVVPSDEAEYKAFVK